MNFIPILQNKALKHKNQVDAIYIIALFLYFTHLFMTTTMFPYDPVIPIFKISVGVAFLVCLYRFVSLRADERGEACLMALLFIAAGLYFVVRRERDFLAYIFMIVGAKDVPFRRIVKLLVTVGAVIMAAAIAASRLGIIENLTYVSRGGKLAHALGIVYTTDFAAHAFYLFLGYAYIRRGRFTVPEYIVIAALTILMFEITRARNNTICMLIFLAATTVYRLIMLHTDELTFTRVNNVIIVLSIIFIIMCVATTLAFTIIYPIDQAWFAQLNNVLNGRFGMGNAAYNDHGISLFGSYIEQMGNGSTSISPEWYFFLDISYVSILLCKGGMVFATMLIMELRCIIKCIDKNIYLLMIFAIIALECSVEHHFGELMYNFFMLAVFADLADDKQ